MNEVDSMGLFETINAQANAALDELFAAAEDVQWYTDYEPDADGTEYADASWIMGDTVKLWGR